ncbi:MAG: hypothetical protein HZA63_15115 [Rhodocyclales bacterium]|nr:hypothetical protein [Rhodocyclales bacterium]
MTIKYRFLFLCFLFSIFSIPAHSIELSDHRGGILISGEITRGDYKKLILFLRQGRLDPFANAIFLDSPGGDVIEAMRISNLVSRMFGNTFIDNGGKCYSACVMIWASGVVRNIGMNSKLGVHRINLTRDEINVSKTDKAVRPIAEGVEQYLLRMGVPRKIVDKMNETSTTDLFVFDHKWLIQEDLISSIGYHPTFIDVAQKKCGADPYANGMKTGILPNKQEAMKWSFCIDNVRSENLKLDMSWAALISDKSIQ